MNTIFILIIRFYQLTISRILPHTCRFYPTCSEYSIMVLKKFGVFRGILKIIRRILICNPWGKHGIDLP